MLAMNWNRLFDGLVEDLQTLLQIRGALLIGLLLLLVLSFRWFPALGEAAKFSFAWLLRNSKFAKGSSWQNWAFAIADRFEPDSHLQSNDYSADAKVELQASANQKPVLNPGRRRFPEVTRIITTNREFRDLTLVSANSQYSTYSCEAGNQNQHIVKLSTTKKGDQLLIKEGALLDYLRDSAGDTTYQCYLPVEVDAFQFKRRHAIVFQHNPNRYYSAREIVARQTGGLDGRHLGWMFNRMLTGIGFAHRQGTIHAAMMPQHLLFDIHSHGLQIVDWTQAKRVGRRLGCFPRKHAHWFPGEAKTFGNATAATDIFMAAKCAVFLAGGDPRTNLVPQHLPATMRCFLKACLLDAVGMRPNDAWELQEEFADLLEDIYGPPSFHQLEMIER